MLIDPDPMTDPMTVVCKAKVLFLRPLHFK